VSHIGDFYVCFTEVAPSLSSGFHVAVKFGTVRGTAGLDPIRRCSGSISGSALLGLRLRQSESESRVLTWAQPAHHSGPSPLAGRIPACQWGPWGLSLAASGSPPRPRRPWH
jgi:hypothetical protein